MHLKQSHLVCFCYQKAELYADQPQLQHLTADMKLIILFIFHGSRGLGYYEMISHKQKQFSDIPPWQELGQICVLRL